MFIISYVVIGATVNKGDRSCIAALPPPALPSSDPPPLPLFLRSSFACAFCAGIDEIGVEIEEPFAILPLLDLCNALKRDVKIAVDNADAFKESFEAAGGKPPAADAVPAEDGAALG